MPDDEDTTWVRRLVERLGPVMLGRVATTARLSRDLPDEILLLESVVVLRKELHS
jgi:hypothetical protein